jgi:hypothetical protein
MRSWSRNCLWYSSHVHLIHCSLAWRMLAYVINLCFMCLTREEGSDNGKTTHYISHKSGDSANIQHALRISCCSCCRSVAGKRPALIIKWPTLIIHVAGKRPTLNRVALVIALVYFPVRLVLQPHALFTLKSSLLNQWTNLFNSNHPSRCSLLSRASCVPTARAV